MSPRSKTRQRGKQKRESRKRQSRQRPTLTPHTKRDFQIFEKVLAAVSLSRREGLDLRYAAKIEGTRISTIQRYAPSALEKHKGKYRVKAFDPIPRVLNVPGHTGMIRRAFPGSRSASKIARYMNAVRALIYKNDPSGLAEFQGKKVAGYKFVTDISKLKHLANFGLLSLDRLYAGVTRGR